MLNQSSWSGDLFSPLEAAAMLQQPTTGAPPVAIRAPQQIAAPLSKFMRHNGL